MFFLQAVFIILHFSVDPSVRRLMNNIRLLMEHLAPKTFSSFVES